MTYWLRYDHLNKKISIENYCYFALVHNGMNQSKITVIFY